LPHTGPAAASIRLLFAEVRPTALTHPRASAHLTLSAFDSGSTRLLVAAFAAFFAGIVNSVAGGGTLLTFPALIAAGLSPLVANATSTVALLPASLSSMHGYRDELTGARRWAVALAVPSLTGGGLGALLLLHTSNATFNRIVPWLVLGATTLFLLQRQLMRWIRGVEGVTASDEELGRRSPGPALLAAQFLVGVYGGYFGAGIGILMLATLGFMGFTNIHRMNGLKNWGAFCMNLVAAITFAFSGIVQWPVALSMAVGSIAGGYAGARAAQLLPQAVVRGVVTAVGVGSGVWLLLR
jgi:uncharacterized membrane protein YfcA